MILFERVYKAIKDEFTSRPRPGVPPRGSTADEQAEDESGVNK